MKTLLKSGFVMFIVLFAGCKRYGVEPDFMPPSPPRGLATLTGDGVVDLSWYANPEPDVAGYNVFVSSSYDGSYTLIGSASEPYFVDRAVRNGSTYYYAVSAYDYNGNESDLSMDVAYETPRPEGYDVLLRDYRAWPDAAGYDFSTYTAGPYDDQYTDVYFENYNGEYYLDVWDDTDIQDVGATQSIYDVPVAPDAGWSTTKDARVFAGHTYVVWTWDNHFAKIRVTSVSSNRVVFDWAYQLQSGNPRVKRAVPSDRGSLLPGAGVQGRK